MQRQQSSSWASSSSSVDSSAARGSFSSSSADAVVLSRSSSQGFAPPPIVYDGQPVIDITQMLELVEEEEQDWSTKDWGWDPITASCAAVHVPRQDPAQVRLIS